MGMKKIKCYQRDKQHSLHVMAAVNVLYHCLIVPPYYYTQLDTQRLWTTIKSLEMVIITVADL